jgi:hypothetical protein
MRRREFIALVGDPVSSCPKGNSCMERSWVIERWETPLSDVEYLIMTSLINDREGTLRITFEDPKGHGWRLSFNRRRAGYRNVDEEYRTTLLRETAESIGYTFTVSSSPWLTELRRDEPLLDVHCKGWQCFLILTTDDVIEVIAADPPIIEEI